MKNPWTKKNPFLSMWLSGANVIAGAARGIASREAAAMMRRSAKQMTEAMTPRPARKKKKRR